jgi:hypothetical protein
MAWRAEIEGAITLIQTEEMSRGLLRAPHAGREDEKVTDGTG